MKLASMPSTGHRLAELMKKDIVIMEWRASHDHTLITADTDFAHLLALMRTRAPSVLILRTADHAPSTVVPLILQVIVQWEA